MPATIMDSQGGGSSQPDNTRFDYDDAVDDFLKDLPVNAQSNSRLSPAPDAAKDVDEEVKVRKKRAPVPKLDQDRLLSDPGIPKLRRIAKTKLKFKGKGHEFSDMSRLLNMYQLWLDDLYPRAKFRDGLALIEKAGHTKRMQVTRRTWIEETKPRGRDPSPDRIEDELMREANTGTGAAESGDKENDSNNQQDGPDEDELDALLAESGPSASTAPAPSQLKPRGPFEDDDDDDQDDLDALMAEQESTNGPAASIPAAATNPKEPQDDFADEEEIMAGMDW